MISTLSRWLSAPAQEPRRPKPRTRLRLEAMEDRLTPATFWVDGHDGNNNNSGSSSAPFQTVQKAIAAATANGTSIDTINVKPSYEDSDTAYINWDPIYLKSNIILQGSGGSVKTVMRSPSDDVFKSEKDVLLQNVTISNFDFRDSYSALAVGQFSTSLTGSDLPNRIGGKNIKFNDNVVTNCRGRAVSLWGVEGFEIKRNVMTGCTTEYLNSTGNVGQSGGTVVIDNMKDSTRSQIVKASANGQISQNTILHNKFTTRVPEEPNDAIDGAGIYVGYNCNNVRIASNVIGDNFGAGIRLNSCNNIDIVQNTVWRNVDPRADDAKGQIQIGGSRKPFNINIIGNIVVANSTDPDQVTIRVDPACTNVYAMYNVLWNDTWSARPDQTGYKVEYTDDATGTNTIGNPDFVDANGNGIPDNYAFTLQGGSPALNKLSDSAVSGRTIYSGQSTKLLSGADVNNKTRPTTGAEIGAVEM